MGYKRQSGPDTIYALSDPLGRFRSARRVASPWVASPLGGGGLEASPRQLPIGPGVGLDDYIGRLTANIRSNRTASPSTLTTCHLRCIYCQAHAVQLDPWELSRRL